MASLSIHRSGNFSSLQTQTFVFPALQKPESTPAPVDPQSFSILKTVGSLGARLGLNISLSLAGSATGALAGKMIGSILVPGVGGAVGALVGGALFSGVGGGVGEMLSQKYVDHEEKLKWGAIIGSGVTSAMSFGAGSVVSSVESQVLKLNAQGFFFRTAKYIQGGHLTGWAAFTHRGMINAGQGMICRAGGAIWDGENFREIFNPFSLVSDVVSGEVLHRAGSFVGRKLKDNFSDWFPPQEKLLTPEGVLLSADAEGSPKTGRRNPQWFEDAEAGRQEGRSQAAQNPHDHLVFMEEGPESSGGGSPRRSFTLREDIESAYQKVRDGQNLEPHFISRIQAIHGHDPRYFERVKLDIVAMATTLTETATRKATTRRELAAHYFQGAARLWETCGETDKAVAAWRSSFVSVMKSNLSPETRADHVLVIVESLFHLKQSEIGLLPMIEKAISGFMASGAPKGVALAQKLKSKILLRKILKAEHTSYDQEQVRKSLNEAEKIFADLDESLEIASVNKLRSLYLAATGNMETALQEGRRAFNAYEQAGNRPDAVKSLLFMIGLCRRYSYQEERMPGCMNEIFNRLRADDLPEDEIRHLVIAALMDQDKETKGIFPVLSLSDAYALADDYFDEAADNVGRLIALENLGNTLAFENKPAAALEAFRNLETLADMNSETALAEKARLGIKQAERNLEKGQESSSKPPELIFDEFIRTRSPELVDPDGVDLADSLHAALSRQFAAERTVDSDLLDQFASLKKYHREAFSMLRDDLVELANILALWADTKSFFSTKSTIAGPVDHYQKAARLFEVTGDNQEAQRIWKKLFLFAEGLPSEKMDSPDRIKIMTQAAQGYGENHGQPYTASNMYKMIAQEWEAIGDAATTLVVTSKTTPSS